MQVDEMKEFITVVFIEINSNHNLYQTVGKQISDSFGCMLYVDGGHFGKINRLNRIKTFELNVETFNENICNLPKFH